MKKTIKLSISIEDFLEWIFERLKKNYVRFILILSAFFILFYFSFTANFGSSKLSASVDFSDLDLNKEILRIAAVKISESQEQEYKYILDVPNKDVNLERFLGRAFGKNFLRPAYSKYFIHSIEAKVPAKFKNFFVKSIPILENNYKNYINNTYKQAILDFYEIKFKNIYDQRLRHPLNYAKNHFKNKFNTKESKRGKYSWSLPTDPFSKIENETLMKRQQSIQNKSLFKLYINEQTADGRLNITNLLTINDETFTFIEKALDKEIIFYKKELELFKNSEETWFQQLYLYSTAENLYLSETSKIYASDFKKFVRNEINSLKNQYENDLKKIDAFIKKKNIEEKFKITIAPYNYKSPQFILGVYFLLVSFLLIVYYICFKITLAFK